MRIHSKHVAILLVAAITVFTGALPAFSQQKAGDKSGVAGADSRAKDQAAIRAVMESVAKAFTERNAKALAAHWTSEGEYQNDQGVSVHGQAALEKAFADFFARTPEVEVKLQPQALRLLSNDAGIDEGKVFVRRGPVDPAIDATYSALVVRENGNWRLAQLTESTHLETSIEDLAWLIGDWKSTTGADAEIRTTYAWAANKKFIHVKFTIKERELAVSGDQVIGIDPSTGLLHTWTFESDGGIGNADWNRDGDHWALDLVGTLSDGGTFTETNVLRKINNDTFTWQSVERWLDDAPIADLAPVKVTRIKAAPGAAR